MTRMFESTEERHKYYREFLIELGNKYQVHFGGNSIEDICLFIDSTVTASKVSQDLESGTLAIPIPKHFIPDGARCPSCGTEITGDDIVEDKSYSVRSVAKCKRCDEESTYFMSSVIADLLKGSNER